MGQAAPYVLCLISSPQPPDEERLSILNFPMGTAEAQRFRNLLEGNTALGGKAWSQAQGLSEDFSGHPPGIQAVLIPPTLGGHLLPHPISEGLPSDVPLPSHRVCPSLILPSSLVYETLTDHSELADYASLKHPPDMLPLCPIRLSCLYIFLEAFPKPTQDAFFLEIYLLKMNHMKFSTKLIHVLN